MPGNACIYSEELDSESDEYKEILNGLNVDNGHVYDISIHSKDLAQYVTKLDNGTFEVSIPVPADYEGKKLAVYYLTESNGKEEHMVTVKDGYANFTTDHFSKYTLTERAEFALDKKVVDPKYYEARSGSTEVTLKKDYIKTLSVGEHTLTIESTDGSALTKFYITASKDSPDTGDRNDDILWGVLAMVMAATLTACIAGLRKRKGHN